jgi:hypothetical protein
MSAKREQEETESQPEKNVDAEESNQSSNNNKKQARKKKRRNCTMYDH